jgi:hypothetical protein
MVGEKKARSFNFYPKKSGAIGESPAKIGTGSYPGSLEINGRAMKFYTDVANPPKPTVLEINATIISTYIDGDTSLATSSSIELTNEEKRQIKKEAHVRILVEAGYDSLGASAKVEAEANLKTSMENQKKEAKRVVNRENNKFTNRAGQMKIGLHNANILMDYKGKIFYGEARTVVTFMTFDKIKNQAQYKKKLHGAYSKATAIGMLNGLSMQNMKDKNGRDIDTIVQRVVAVN